MSDDDAPSFVRGIFSGALHDALLFPFPDPLDERDPDEARTVRRLLDALDGCSATGSSIRRGSTRRRRSPSRRSPALATDGLARPHDSQGVRRRWVCRRPAYARVFGEVSRLDASLGVLDRRALRARRRRRSCSSARTSRRSAICRCSRAARRSPRTRSPSRTSGSDAQNIKTRARLSDDGSHWILNGRKQWIGNGHRAGVIATFAQTPSRASTARPCSVRRRSSSAPTCRASASSARCGRWAFAARRRPSWRTRDLHVPADHVLGTVGKGFAVAVHVLNGGRLTLAAGCTAGTKQILARDARVHRGARSVRQADRRLRDHAAQDRAHGVGRLRVGRDARRARAARRVARRRTTRSRRRAARCSRARCSGARRTRWCSSPAGAAS